MVRHDQANTCEGFFWDTASREDLFHSVFNHIQTGIFIVDAEDHIITDVNPNALEVLGFTRGDLIGRACHGVICPTPCGECPVSDFNREISNAEQAVIGANGKVIPVMKTVAKIRIRNKDYLIESFIDIRDRKRSEDRKIALIAFMNEAVMRVRKPLELTSRGLEDLAVHIVEGNYDTEDIRMQLQTHANNLARMVKTLEDLNERAIQERGIEIPDHFRNFCLGK